MRKVVSVVIADLDDTLWDWVGIWYRSFKAMLDQLVQDSGVPRESLLKDFKEVFRKHGTTEYVFAIEELHTLREKHEGDDLTLIYQEAIKAYQKARSKALKLYPGVLDTLEVIKDKDVLLVGYTESMAFYTRYRFRKLRLDRIFDYLYSPRDHDLPEGLTREQIRRYSPEHYELRRTIHRHTPPEKRKPSPEILLSIIRQIGARPEDVIYIGDKLFKDVYMAQAAGVTDVYAKYGEAHEREEYELLKQVTHWSESDVRKERETTADDLRPSCILEKSFSEILNHFDFKPFVDKSEPHINRVVDIWKKTVDVQQHFNDIELKIRNYAITLFVAVLGAAGLVLREGYSFQIWEHKIKLASLLFFAGALGLMAFWIMDRHWYHRLLYGAVKHGESIEKKYMNTLSELALTKAISEESPMLWGKLHSKGKMLFFYGLLFLMLIAGGFASHYADLGKNQETPVTSQPVQRDSAVGEEVGQAGK